MSKVAGCEFIQSASLIYVYLDGNTVFTRSKDLGFFLYTIRNNLINEYLSFRLRQAEELFVALPQVHQEADGREPRFFLRAVQMNCAVIQESGKQLIVAYPTSAFFESASLSIFRAVPLNIASVIAAL